MLPDQSRLYRLVIGARLTRAIILGGALLLASCGDEPQAEPGTVTTAGTLSTPPSSVDSATTHSPEAAPTTTAPPDSDAGWISEPTLGPSDVGGVTGVDSGTLGTYVVAGSGSEFRYIFRRGNDGWEAVHEIPMSGEPVPETLVAVGFGAVVVLQSGDHQAARFGAHHRLTVSVSNDGVAWSTEAPVGLPDDVVVAGVAATASGFAAAGWAREEGSTGTTRIWESADGVSWSEVIRWSRDDASIESLAADGDVVVAVGESDRKSASWSSVDGWALQRFNSGMPARFGDVAAVSGRFYALGSPRSHDRFLEGPLLAVSPDGASWSMISEEDRPFPGRLASVTGGTQLAVLGNDVRLIRHRNYCFLNGCGLHNVVLYTYTPEMGWRERAIPGREHGILATRVLEADDVLLLVSTQGGELAAWRESEAVAANPIQEIEPPEIPYEWVERDVDVELEIGVVYAMRVGTHCGIDHLANWGGVDWRVREGWQYPTGVDSENEIYYGTVERVREDLIVFKVGDVVYAEYEPTERRLLCE